MQHLPIEAEDKYPKYKNKWKDIMKVCKKEWRGWRTHEMELWEVGVKTTQNSVNVGPKLATKITKPEVPQGGGVKDMFKRGDRK